MNQQERQVEGHHFLECKASWKEHLLEAKKLDFNQLSQLYSTWSKQGADRPSFHHFSGIMPNKGWILTPDFQERKKHEIPVEIIQEEGKEEREKTMSIALKQVFNKDKTFRPKRKFEPGTQRFELHKRAQASLNSGVDLKAAVQLPSGEDQNDWVAVHVVDFFNRINLIYGTICEFCTERTCPVMSGGPKYEYRWQDDLKYKKPTALPAPQYMNLLMDWIEVQINNEDIFPTCVGEFP
ncbi:MOB kinase activator 3B [Camelus dromedarius]|uniref:MOB kinase activator 3B n=1 Tax=Camelus dromedarius TaxID=9838 RepID=A0A5N4E9N1_CAMDR|nr:MOB kinase activator 3B [Camelus dromedarius]